MRTNLNRQWLFNFSLLGSVVLILAGAGWLFAKAIASGSTFLGALLAAMATVTTVALGRVYERKKAAEAVRREQLGGLYEQLASVMAGHELTSRATEKFATQFMRKGLVYAGPNVLTAFRDWRNRLHDEESSPAAVRESMLRYEVLVKALRKDLGISNWMLQEGDLLRVALTDFDAAFAGESSAIPEPPGEPIVRAAAPVRR